MKKSYILKTLLIGLLLSAISLKDVHAVGYPADKTNIRAQYLYWLGVFAHLASQYNTQAPNLEEQEDFSNEDSEPVPTPMGTPIPSPTPLPTPTPAPRPTQRTEQNRPYRDFFRDVYFGRFASLNENLRQDDDLNTPDETGITALQRASFRGDLEMVRFLIEHGAGIDYSANRSEIPSHGRLQLIGNEEAFSAINQLPSPLFYAIQKGQIDVVRYLVNHGATLFPQINEITTALHQAMLPRSPRQSRLEIIAFLLATGQIDVNARNIYGNTALHTAAEYGYVDVISLLLQAGANIEMRGQDGQTPLLLATAKGHNEVVHTLLINGANPNQADNDNCTPLHQAALHGNLDAVRLLLEYGADTEQRSNNDQITPLILAAVKEHAHIIELLISHGADTQAFSSNGMDASHMAYLKKNLDILITQLRHGISLSEKKYNRLIEYTEKVERTRSLSRRSMRNFDRNYIKLLATMKTLEDGEPNTLISEEDLLRLKETHLTYLSLKGQNTTPAARAIQERLNTLITERQATNKKAKASKSGGKKSKSKKKTKSKQKQQGTNQAKALKKKFNERARAILSILMDGFLPGQIPEDVALQLEPFFFTEKPEEENIATIDDAGMTCTSTTQDTEIPEEPYPIEETPGESLLEEALEEEDITEELSLEEAYETVEEESGTDEAIVLETKARKKKSRSKRPEARTKIKRPGIPNRHLAETGESTATTLSEDYTQPGAGHLTPSDSIHFEAYLDNHFRGNYEILDWILEGAPQASTPSVRQATFNTFGNNLAEAAYRFLTEERGWPEEAAQAFYKNLMQTFESSFHNYHGGGKLPTNYMQIRVRVFINAGLFSEETLNLLYALKCLRTRQLMARNISTLSKRGASSVPFFIPHHQLRNLNGIERSAFPDLISDDPKRKAMLKHIRLTQASDIAILLKRSI